jgi:DnaJ-class molecular chaperone
MQDQSTAHSAQSPPEEREMRECRSCYGGGMVTEDREVAYGWWEAEQLVCPICRGSGQVLVWLYPGARSSR